MPQLRSFSTFAPAPNLAQSYLGGIDAMNKVQQVNNEFQLGQQKIAAASQQAQMENATKMQAINMQNMRQQQELEMEKAYKEQALQMKNRELQQQFEMESRYKEGILAAKNAEMQQAQQAFNFKVQEAAAMHTATQDYQSEAQKLIEGGMDPNKAYMQSALKHGPQMKLPSGAYTQAFKGQAESNPNIGKAHLIEGLPEGVKEYALQTGPNSFNHLTLPATLANGGDAPPGYSRFGNRIVRQVDTPAVADMKKQRDNLQKIQDKQGFAAGFAAQMDAGEDISKSSKVVAMAYKKRQSEIDALQRKIDASRQAGSGSEHAKAPAGAKEGQRFQSKKKPGTFGVVKDGYIVPEEELNEEYDAASKGY